MSRDKTPAAKDAGAEYAEIWGEAVHTNRHLRTITVGARPCGHFVAYRGDPHCLSRSPPPGPSWYGWMK